MYIHEDLALDLARERMRQLQREMEYSRSMARALAGRVSLVCNLAVRGWWRAGLVMRRQSHRHSSHVAERHEQEAATKDRQALSEEKLTIAGGGPAEFLWPASFSESRGRRM